MKRFQLVNWFVLQYGYRSYLEIGVDKAEHCHNRVRCERKVGVDPNVGKTNPPQYYRMTSDAFFAQNKEHFDIVFIDGLHTCEQVIRDVLNSLAVLNQDGTIIMHDCHPYNARVGGEARIAGISWYGTVWRAWGHFRRTKSDLTMHVYNDDCGCGIIRRGSQVCYSRPCESWQDYASHQQEILQLISDKELAAHYGKPRK